MPLAWFRTKVVQCYDLWLDPGMHDVRVVSDTLKPYPADLMRSYPVSNRVNSVANDDAECSTPTQVTPALTHTTLF
jgi:putative SOS response-associated peptidase YedK